MALNKDILSQAANQARGLAMDAVAACKSGHLGLPLGCAEIGAALFGSGLQYDPKAPRWQNRDRFILSAGHGSMFLYAWLHLSGYDLSLDEVKSFRKLHSKTPGHPEFGETDGVESTTGPLGQGIGNAVGMAVAARMRETLFNTAEDPIFDHHIVVLAGDGCLQEGVSMEAVAFAGHNGLDNLILIYDCNAITLDAAADKTQSEDAAARFRAIGWEVQSVDGNDMEAFLAAYNSARDGNNGKPHIIIAHTVAGKGIKEVEGSFKAHGEAGVPFIDEARAALGLPAEKFHVSQDVRNYFAEHAKKLAANHSNWLERLAAWKKKNPEKAALLGQMENHSIPSDLLKRIPEFAPDYADATRSAGSVVIQPLAKEIPYLLSGSADLHGSTKNYIKDVGDFSRTTPAGRNLYFGIREHAMGAMLNGIAYDGMFIASGATFLTFSDYCRPSIRLAALAKLPVFYIFTHDSVGVGEDGPTHQPVETVSALRCIPNLDVIRPADPEETAAAFVAAVTRKDGPTALILTRQKVPTLNSIPVAERRQGTLKGGYIAAKEKGALKTILIACGSELHLCLEAAKQLGDGVRVVSIPCFERFDSQSAEYRESVLPAACTARVAIDAGISALWWKYVGTQGRIIAIDRFGISAPGDIVMKELGINVDAVVEAAG